MTTYVLFRQIDYYSEGDEAHLKGWTFMGREMAPNARKAVEQYVDGTVAKIKKPEWAIGKWVAIPIGNWNEVDVDQSVSLTFTEPDGQMRIDDDA